MDRVDKDCVIGSAETCGQKQTKKLMCLLHKSEEISFLNLVAGVEASNRFQCIECQYEQNSKNQKINFLPIKKIETAQIDDVFISRLYNWPIISDESQNKFQFLEQLCAQATNSLEEVVRVVDNMIKEYTQVLEEYKKSSIIFYNDFIQQAQKVIIELSDIDSLQKIKDIIFDGSNENLMEISVKIDEIIQNRYKNQDNFSQQIFDAHNMYSSQFKKHDDFGINLSFRHEKLIQFVQQFTKSKKVFQKPEIHLTKSTGRDSHKLDIKTQQNEIVIQKLTDYYAWCYSSSTLDNHETYEMEFFFDNEPQNYIMVGLIPDDHKDTQPPGSGQSHFCKIFGDNNSFYCGNLVKGDLIEKTVKEEEIIKMRVCIEKNELIFYDEYGNINSLHQQYNLEEFSKYRICIQFGQRSKNTIRIFKFATVFEENINLN
ncbi:hypothetical protein TTHERM_00285240 (macronuclear) [Tetrahymena thermophila SB210]|uniref:Uncharacterized protein n=1 Tax=Tetrahymena thermophila (strain SB210) TaxID=312017 RepID=I7LVI4_TETTS|nr:hypothetical protein TTHERM_00285240 [Tetrahymena thermophila SB210]EAR98293.1 hypothetical protein TTHERM_00285240 [Tetrahymena thermophila SB210]|eukprot:XP_001018538.1 hypothetical protein TTHERM_00285240 [Tetrahymena thermophila SB210]